MKFMDRSHPYNSASESAFWSRAVSRNWDASTVSDGDDPLIQRRDKVVSAGSCFAANITPYLEREGLTYLRTEKVHPAFSDLEPEALGYAKFSSAYGNIYTARQMLQLVQRFNGGFSPAEDRWVEGGEVIDPFRPGLKYRARSSREFDALTLQHLRLTREAFENADVFVFTLGLTEAWISRVDGAVFPACPGTVAGRFDPELHEFKNFTVSEVVGDLNSMVALLRSMNPELRIILTVSPVPLVATASGHHVLSASTYSKSVLRVAAEEVATQQHGVVYFPSYEIVTGPQAPESFFEADRRNVSQSGVEAVMAAFLSRCEGRAEDSEAAPRRELAQPSSDRSSELSKLIVEAECEEAMADRGLTG